MKCDKMISQSDIKVFNSLGFLKNTYTYLNQCHKSTQLPINSSKITLHYKYTFMNITDAKDNVINDNINETDFF